jgi:hypothetical protein
MGLKGILQKAFMGASTEESNENKEKMRQIFNRQVENGNSYTLMYCYTESYTNAILVEITKHANFIVGYKEGEVVVIPVDADLTDIGDSYIFNKANNSQIKCSAFTSCFVGNDEISFNFIPMEYRPAINRGSEYKVAIIQSHKEVTDMQKFFKAGF